MPPLYNSKSKSSRGWLCLGFRICSYPTLDSDLRHRVLGNSQYGAGAVALQIAQVGNDLEAMMFLGRVDKDPGIGHLVDCTSSKLHSGSGDIQLAVLICSQITRMSLLKWRRAIPRWIWRRSCGLLSCFWARLTTRTTARMRRRGEVVRLDMEGYT